MRDWTKKIDVRRRSNINKLVSNPPMEKVTLNGAIAHNRDKAIPTRLETRDLPSCQRRTQEIASMAALASQEMRGNGACAPPEIEPIPTRIKVYNGVVVPSTRSPGLNTKPFPAKILREYR
jgi:hypothetical protein